jgi:hypothetical protein
MSSTTGFELLRFGEAGWRRASAAALCCAYLVGAAVALAEPTIPVDGAEVLERLPVRAGGEWRDIAELRAQLGRDPGSPAVAADLAQRYLALFRAEGDPRLVAYAAHALDPWSAQPDPPADVALRRAEIAQSEHRFDSASADLARLLARDPRNARAWLTAASIDLVRGEYRSSREACARLVLIEDPVVTGACFAAVQAATGEAARAYDFLARALAEPESLSSELLAWLETLAAETAEVLGDDEGAARHYRAALAAGLRPSIYLLAAYSDLLLRAGRPEQTIVLLCDAPAADSLALRLALAEKRTNALSADRRESLEFRLQLSLEGLEATHAREAAYFALHVLDRPRLALERALSNWAIQREPIDARLVLEAAIAAGEPEAARPVLQWLAENAVEHAGLRRLAEGLRS